MTLRVSVLIISYNQESLIEETLRIKPERHHLVQGSDIGSGGLVALSQTGG